MGEKDEAKSFWKAKKEYMKEKWNGGLNRLQFGKGGGKPKEPKPEGGGTKIKTDDQGKLTFEKSSHTGAIIAFVIIVFLALLAVAIFTDIAAVRTLFDGIGLGPYLNQIRGQLGYWGEYWGCVIDNSRSFSFGDPTAGSFGGFVGFGPFEICDQLVGTNAQEIGCAECFQLSVEAPNPRLFAGTGQDAIIRATVSAEDEEFCYTDILGQQSCQAVTPAIGATIKINASTVEAQLAGRCTDGGCDLDPPTLPFTVIGTFEGEQFCSQKAVNAQAELSYVYRTEGSAPINIIAEGAEDVSFTSRSPITLPGPIKMDIIPDKYQSGDGYGQYDELAFVSIRFRNQGQGSATVTGIELEQITPEGKGPLNIVECFGPIANGVPRSVDANTVSIPVEGGFIKLDASTRSSTIICNVEVGGARPASGVATYVLVGSATYEYKLVRKASSIIVDNSQCAPGTTTPGTTPPGTTTGGGAPSSTTPGSTGGATCDNPAPETKICPSGTTFNEDGCCR